MKTRKRLSREYTLDEMYDLTQGLVRVCKGMYATGWTGAVDVYGKIVGQEKNTPSRVLVRRKDGWVGSVHIFYLKLRSRKINRLLQRHARAYHKFWKDIEKENLKKPKKRKNITMPYPDPSSDINYGYWLDM